MSAEMCTTGEVARALGVTINTVKGWIRAGQLVAVRLPSGHYRVPRSALERLLNEGSRGGSEALRLNSPEPPMVGRRRSWEAFGRWRRAREPEPVALEEALAHLDSMLELSRQGGTLAPRPAGEKAVGIARMRRGLACVAR